MTFIKVFTAGDGGGGGCKIDYIDCLHNNADDDDDDNRISMLMMS